MTILANSRAGGNLSIFLLCLITSSGCTRQQPPSPTSLSMAIGSGTLVYYVWNEGRPAVMICSDIQGGAGGLEDHISGPPWVRKEKGYTLSSDGRRFDWQLETGDGRSVNCQVDGKEYDLSKGTLFLVKTMGGKTDVEQLSRDLSAAKPETESCKDFARKDPTLSKFLGMGSD